MPRAHVKVLVLDSKGHSYEGGLDLPLIIGFSLHQTWINLLTLFSELPQSLEFLIRGTASGVGAHQGAVFAALFILTYIFVLLAVGFRARPFVLACKKRPLLYIAGLFAALGSVWTVFLDCGICLNIPLVSLCGVMGGCGASFLLLAWGASMSMRGGTEVALNSILGLAASVALTALVSFLPGRAICLVSTILPLVEIPFLRKSLFGRIGVEGILQCKPARIKKISFAVRVGVPMLFAGAALSALHLSAARSVHPGVESFAAASASLICLILLLGGILASVHRDEGLLLRAVMPISLFAICAIPPSYSGSLPAASIVNTGFVLLEAFTWLFFAHLSQKYRIPSSLSFGAGRGLMSLGCAIGFLSIIYASLHWETSPLESANCIFVLMASAMTAYILMPKDAEIAALLVREPEGEPVGCSVGPGASPQAADSPQTEIIGTDLARECESESLVGMSSETNAEESETENDSSFRSRCLLIADRYLLSRRETEVLLLIARGHNAEYVKDKLYITQNTAKTHIHHIYRKLDIHSQQELLAMVFDARE